MEVHFSKRNITPATNENRNANLLSRSITVDQDDLLYPSIHKVFSYSLVTDNDSLDIRNLLRIRVMRD